MQFSTLVMLALSAGANAYTVVSNVQHTFFGRKLLPIPTYAITSCLSAT